MLKNLTLLKTMTNDLHILEEVSRTSIQLLLREPFYAHILACLNRQVVSPASEIKTLATGVRDTCQVLYINPVYWDGLLSNPAIRYGVLKHELLHIIFKHTLVQDLEKDRLLVHIAMDLVVNQYILPENLPPEAILLVHFPELQLPADQPWVYYYQRLDELQTERWGRYHQSLAATYLEDLRSSSAELDRHLLWDHTTKLTSLGIKILEGAIDHMIERAYRKMPPKSISHLPGRLQIYLEGFFLKPQPLTDWRRVIQLFAASSAKTKIKNTIQRLSKRYGTAPGIKVKRLRKLLIAVDTSGSIKEEETRLFFNEIYHLWRQGAEIQIVECDVEIQYHYEYRGQLPAFVSGGGGTSFNAPIQYGNLEFLPDGLIYFTDGRAPIPQIKARFPILWVISPEGLALHSEEFRKLPGQKVKLRC